MLKTAQIACPIDHKITALKTTQNPLAVMRKPSSLVQTAIICSSVGIEKFPEEASQTETTMFYIQILGKEFINFSKPLKFKSQLERLSRPLSFQGVSLLKPYIIYSKQWCCIAMKLLHTSGLKGHCLISVILLFSQEMELTSTIVIPLPRSRANSIWTLLTVSASLTVRLLPGKTRRGQNSKLKVNYSNRTQD